MKGAIYSRFSTDRQTDSSIADQVRVCTEYAERQGWSITHQFEDQGISGAALGNRPGVLALQEAALAGRVDVLLVMDLSRLSRSQADLPKLIDRLIAKAVRVVGVQDGYDSARKGHKLQAGLSGIIGEAFREMVKDRTYAALESRAKDRRPTGGRAYGYRDGPRLELEARDAPRQWLYGVNHSRDRPQRALPRHREVEHQRMAQGSRQR
jgi:site-specific DNA recombinase